MGMNEGKKPHAIMIAIPLQGHINPFVHLALKLASKGLAITFVHTEHVHQTLTKTNHNNTIKNQEVDFFFEARESGLDILYTTIHDGFPLEFDRDLNFLEYWEGMFHNFPDIVDEFVGKMIESEPYLDHFLVADTFYSWSATIAKKHDLLNVSFWTQPALELSLGYHLELLRQNAHVPWNDHIDEEIDYVPGVKSISTRDLMPQFKEFGDSTIHQMTFTSFDEVKKTDFILSNTVQELESETLRALNKKQPTYAIGPINFSKNLAGTTITKSLRSESDCSKWLESKPRGSVLYVSFGSLVQMSKQVIEEIAYGLLLSGVNFIWVVRLGILGADTEILPSGFENEVKERGLIIPWCNQVMILSDPAVGGFLTHCGWNSMLESMWCGVPMICHPITYDQPPNRKLVVDDLKIGINLCDRTSVNRQDVAEKLKNFINGNTLMPEIKKVQSLVKNAIENGGSSEKNFDKFVEDLISKFHAS